MTNQEIIDICTKYGIENYIINPDGSIDVDGDVYLSYTELTELPLKFNRVCGDFSCTANELTSLEGSPNYVGGYFDCYWNPLESLDGYNLTYDKLYCDNKENLIKKHIRKDKLKLINTLL